MTPMKSSSDKDSAVFLTTAQLAKRWNMDAGTLENWRQGKKKKVPPFVKIGTRKVAYRVSDIIEFERIGTVKGK